MTNNWNSFSTKNIFSFGLLCLENGMGERIWHWSITLYNLVNPQGLSFRRSNNFPLISHIIILTRVYIYFHLLLFVCGLTQFRKLSMTFYSIYLTFLTFHSCSMVDWMNRQSLNKLIVKNFLIEFSILAESVQPSNRSKHTSIYNIRSYWISYIVMNYTVDIIFVNTVRMISYHWYDF